MTTEAYAVFLDPAHHAAATHPRVSTWWRWQDHQVHIARPAPLAAALAAPADGSVGADPPKPPRPAVRVLVIHGGGGHSGALWPITSLLAAQGLDVAAVDLPLYGRTLSLDPGAVRYQTWVRLLVDLLDAEHDDRPLILLGASMGGMLAYEAAARSPHVAAVGATSLLDPQDWRVRARLTRFGPLAVAGAQLTRLIPGGAAQMRVPMRAVADFAKMSRDPDLAELCASDPLGGGARIPVGFLSSFLNYDHVPGAEMTTPVTLLHPTHDAWTPVQLSMRFLLRIAAPTEAVMLRRCGHFPIEEPGVSDLVAAVVRLAGRHIETGPPA
ncbi:MULTISPECIES: alpha/beta fold hydrolase [unclassified Nesterenkonia]|uniref:alpha/beta fold hydrolase n=1 Tax=unclassified Nesterenkonia TaxID=2629769 RepID=UPI001F4D2E25|nr:alpha/beta hydrolase [Nesterenkonia sp. DZ6]MCH8563476.1 alpha/beta hydrolase [Nesterenkonia sp. YGD6]